MTELEGEEIIQARAQAGARIVIAQEGDWASMKALRTASLEAGIPAALGRCPGKS